MNIRYLKECISKLDEIKVVGRTVVTDNSTYHIMGFVRQENKLKMLVLQYDEEFREREEEREINEINGIEERIFTNRGQLKAKDMNSPENTFNIMKGIEWGDVKLSAAGSQQTRCSVQDWEITVGFSEFIRNGWNPSDIEHISIDNLFFSTIEFSGEFDCIPDFDKDSSIKVLLDNDYKTYFVQQPFSLEVGAEYKDKLWYKDKTGEDHWFQINSVYLMDILSEVQKNFDEPHIKERLSPEEITEMKENIKKEILKMCPIGMRFPVIEYECEDDISLQFYPSSWLDSSERSGDGSSSVGIIMTPDKKTGILGYPLKAAIIQEPFSAETSIIDAELFWIIRIEKREDIIIG